MLSEPKSMLNELKSKKWAIFNGSKIQNDRNFPMLSVYPNFSRAKLYNFFDFIHSKFSMPQILPHKISQIYVLHSLQYRNLKKIYKNLILSSNLLHTCICIRKKLKILSLSFFGQGPTKTFAQFFSNFRNFLKSLPLLKISSNLLHNI